MVSVSSFASKDSGLFDRAIHAFVPKLAVVPLVQDDEEPAAFEVLVKPGDVVAEGQCIAAHNGAHVHASIPGTVQEIIDCEYPNGMQGKAAVIALSGSFSSTGKKLAKNDWKSKDRTDLCAQFAELGVVNTFEGCQLLSRQIQAIPSSGARLLIVRLFDADPSCAIEQYLAEHETEKLLEGITAVAYAMDAKGIVIAQPRKKTPVFSPDALGPFPVAVVPVEAEKYPVGTPRDIAVALRRLKKEAPWNNISEHDIFIDAETALCAFEAAAFSKPVTERYVHVTGSCLNAAAILRVKIGTQLSSLAEHCGGYKKQPVRIVVNGLFSGYAVDSLAIPVTKMVQAVQFQSAAQVKIDSDEACIRCGACHSVCPIGLFPERLYRAFVHGDFASKREKAASRTANLCTHCGLCNAVCPSRLPLCQIMPLLKDATHEKQSN